MAESLKGVKWDLTSFFLKFNGPEMVEFKKNIEEDIRQLQEIAGSLGELSNETAGEWEAIILKAEDIGMRLSHVSAYVGCLQSTYAENEDYSRERGALALMSAEFRKVDVDILRALKDVTDDVFERFTSRKALKGAEYSIKRKRERAKYTMSPIEEKLAADLNVDGFHAWGRLYGTLVGKMKFNMVYPDGRREVTPMSQWDAIMSNPDREIGRAAFEGGYKAWRGIEDTCAATLNAIAGTRLTLNKHRGVDHYLDQALFQSGIKKESLDAMYSAIFDNIDIPRRILRTKASFFGRDGIWWFERKAPLPLEGSSNLTWEEATEKVGTSFEAVYPKLGEYFRSFLKNKWIESESRPGKRPGAYTTGSMFKKEQRVFQTFSGELDNIRGTAHEMGHAFHMYVMNDLRPMAHEVPMTLAETASIFSEHVFAEGIYSDPGISDNEKLLMLDGEVTSAAVLLLDITVRYEFEKAFHDERMKGEVSASRLKELMIESQRKILGDSLLEGGEGELFWVSKGHFYITGLTFYNFPYTFGFLIARAIYGMFKKEGLPFLSKYEGFLKNTGSDSVESVVKKGIGADVQDPEFWAESIRSLEEPLKLYKELLAKQK